MVAARALGLPALAGLEDNISPWPLAYASRLVGVSPPCPTTAQMERTKPPGFAHSLIILPLLVLVWMYLTASTRRKCYP